MENDSTKVLAKLIETMATHVKEDKRRQIFEVVCSELFMDDLDLDWNEVLGIDDAFDETLVEIYPDSFNLIPEDSSVEDDSSDMMDGMHVDEGDDKEQLEDQEDEPLWGDED